MVWIIFNLISFPAPSLFSFGSFSRFFFALQTGLHQIAGRKRFCFADILIFLLSVTFFVVAASPVALLCLSVYCFAVCPICLFFYFEPAWLQMHADGADAFIICFSFVCYDCADCVYSLFLTSTSLRFMALAVGLFRP